MENGYRLFSPFLSGGETEHWRRLVQAWQDLFRSVDGKAGLNLSFSVIDGQQVRNHLPDRPMKLRILMIDWEYPDDGKPPSPEVLELTEKGDVMDLYMSLANGAIVEMKAEGYSEEALDVLQAMNVGHDGSMTTLHANSPSDVLHRMTAMALLARTDLSPSAVLWQFQSGVDLIIHLDRFADGHDVGPCLCFIDHFTEAIGRSTAGHGNVGRHDRRRTYRAGG